jgi:aryl-alcohol dehydrogenase-like predicted oxidoreductase
MDYRFLGRTGLRVSALSFGSATFGGVGDYHQVGSTDVKEAREQVAMCLEAGVNLFDTADIYSFGRAEEILGQALGVRRDEVLLATKVHGRTGEDPNAVGQSRHHIVRAVEASLTRLGTDWIDLLQVHGFDGQTHLEETLRALDDLVRAGKVRYVGCSNFSAWQLMKALSISERHGLERFCVTQVYYSLVAREVEHEIVPLCMDQQVGVVVWGPLTAGLLSGRYRANRPPPPDGRFTMTSHPPVPDLEAAYRIIDVLVEIGDDHGRSPAQVALAWLLHKPAVTSLTLGARSSEQLRDNLQAADLVLSASEVERLDCVSERPLPYPFWHQRDYDAERLPLQRANISDSAAATSR